jgi:hypothetical protein
MKVTLHFARPMPILDRKDGARTDGRKNTVRFHTFLIMISPRAELYWHRFSNDTERPESSSEVPMADAAQITFQVAFDLYQKQYSSLDEIWKFYSTVAIALLSAVVASDKLKATSTGMAVILGGFLFFAVSNLVVILDVHQALIQLAALTNSLASDSQLTKTIVLKASPQWQVGLFHVAADTSFVLAMWLIYKASHKPAPNA